MDCSPVANSNWVISANSGELNAVYFPQRHGLACILAQLGRRGGKSTASRGSPESLRRALVSGPYFRRATVRCSAIRELWRKLTIFRHRSIRRMCSLSAPKQEVGAIPERQENGASSDHFVFLGVHIYLPLCAASHLSAVNKQKQMSCTKPFCWPGVFSKSLYTFAFRGWRAIFCNGPLIRTTVHSNGTENAAVARKRPILSP